MVLYNCIRFDAVWQVLILYPEVLVYIEEQAQHEEAMLILNTFLLLEHQLFSELLICNSTRVDVKWML